MFCVQQKNLNLYLYFAYNFQKCSQVHTAASGNKLIFHIEHLLSFLNYILTLNFNGLIMCTLPLHTKRNTDGSILMAALNGRFIICWVFFLLIA